MYFTLLAFDRDISLERLQNTLGLFRCSPQHSLDDLSKPILFSGFTSTSGYSEDDDYTHITLRIFFSWLHSIDRVKSLRLVTKRIYGYLKGSTNYDSMTSDDKVSIKNYLGEIRGRIFQDFPHISYYFPGMDLSRLLKDDVYLVMSVNECIDTHSVQEISDVVLRIMLSIKEPSIDWQLNNLTERDILGKIVVLIKRANLDSNSNFIEGLRSEFNGSVYNLEYIPFL